jgi:hypothetical protein
MAGLTTTQTFSDGDTVTAAKLNNIVGNASIDANAITTVKIADGDVTLLKMDTASVDTGQLVDDSVHNSKLNDMAAKTVKANATNGAANPTDVPVAANKLLVGTSDSLKAVTFTTDLELDAADNAATLIRISKEAINSQATDLTTLDADLDRLLIYDASGSGSLAKTSPKRIVQSQSATTIASGACGLATAAELIDPSGAATHDVISAATGSPMLAKAWIEFTSTGANEAQSLTNSFNITSLTRSGTGIYDIVFGNGVTGTKFDLPSDNYMLIATGATLYGADYQLFGRITSRTATGVGCTVTFGAYSEINTLRDPDVVASLVFFGLTS